MGYDVLVLEARNRTGGRLNTAKLKTSDAAIDLGAAWIHGVDGNPLTAIAEDNAFKIIETTKDGVTYFDDGTELTQEQSDRSAELYGSTMEKLEENRDSYTPMASLQEAVEQNDDVTTKSDQVLLDAAMNSNIVQEFAASPSKLSAVHYDDEQAFDGDDAIFPGGYIQVADAVGENVTQIKLQHVVKKISHDDEQVVVRALSKPFIILFL
jgi:monoamine oxidase